MLYLLLAILCSAAIALILKWGGKVASSQEYVLSGNYFSATLAAGAALLMTQKPSSLIFGSSEFALLAGLAGIMGILLYSAFRLYQKSIHENGVAITGAFAKMGVLVPTVISMFLWREFPSLPQSIGILITLAALVYYYLPRKGEVAKMTFGVLLLILMLANGSADFMTKIFQKQFPVSEKELFLMMAFFVALLISLFFALRDSKFALKDFSIGIALGIPNVFSSYFLILALQQVIATIAFPVFSAGSLVVITLGGLFLFKEKPGKREWTTIAGILTALIFINL